MPSQAQIKIPGDAEPRYRISISPPEKGSFRRQTRPGRPARCILIVYRGAFKGQADKRVNMLTKTISAALDFIKSCARSATL